MLFIQCVSDAVDVIHNYVIIAFGCEYIFGFQVKVRKRQCIFFPKRQCDVPRALSVGLVVHRPVLGLDNSGFFFRRKAAPLDF